MKKLIYTAAILLSVTVLAGAATRSKKSDVARGVDIFNAVMKQVQTLYVDSFDAEKSVRTAIDAMLDRLDPYTEYIPQSEQADFRSSTSGEYAGIGSYIMQRNGNVYISGPHEGGPAHKAGLRAGDMILTVDGDTMLNTPYTKVTERLKGTPGTKVRVKVIRPYVQDSVIEVEMTREKIQIPSVPFYGVVNDGVGYIMLTSFTDKSPEEVKEALDSFKEHPELKGVVLDLRDNGGGYLESAVKILGYFLPKGTEVLRTRGKGILEEKVYKTSGKPIMPDVPLIVLTDGGTASASEITAGALQDLDRAVIMGSRSFGKGLVQVPVGLPYDGMLKVTVAKYYIPSGRLIQAIDYSHRNADGTVARIPDSLTNEFTTARGRKVRDGGGITPDVAVTYPELSRITYNVVTDNWAFDFANRYAATHPTIAAPGKIEITDSMYADFKAMIDPAKFNYDKVCLTMLDRLREAAKLEGYMTDSLAQQFDVMEGMMKHPLDKDLDTHRKAIEPYLRRELADRYYFRRGEVEAILRDDPALAEATKLLNSADEYRAILSPGFKPEKK
ncbi:MAG: S41 family peptidase [Muribaculaceae bacterium]|nr:S41 family peptidase [Muribaculaceae bacterium]